MHYAAARQFYEREGHLRVPRKHVETIIVSRFGGSGSSGDGQDARELRLGAWIANQRFRTATLSPERTERTPATG
jgi:hypothetical protein